MDRHTLDRRTVDVHAAWTGAEVLAVLTEALANAALPADLAAAILIKPNLNNDLVALTGNSVDLRVLFGLVEVLQARGYTNITVADGANVGIERRGIDVFTRLRVASLADRYGVRVRDLNRADGRRVPLTGDAAPEVSSLVLDADFVISVPKIKTHAEMLLSCACKNWVGICRGQDKRHMHYDLGRNIARMAALHPPDLIVVDGLVGMEGNGPGDGHPVKLGRIVIADDPWACDVVVARMVGFPWRDVPYLVHGEAEGRFAARDADRAQAGVGVVRRFARPPERSRLAILSERRELIWLKKLVRPIVSQPKVTELAYRAKIVQDVYSPENDSLTVRRARIDDCGECQKCAEVCPTRLAREEIGVKTAPPDCVQCLYCWWACPSGAIVVDGDPAHMERQIARYKGEVERL